MRMTIDKAIPKIQFVRNALNDDMEIAKAYDLAIDTMHKYQEIQEIIKAHDNDRIPEDYWYIDKIREVLEDGNNSR